MGYTQRGQGYFMGNASRPFLSREDKMPHFPHDKTEYIPKSREMQDFIS
jgi:hypothetical protein